MQDGQRFEKWVSNGVSRHFDGDRPHRRTLVGLAIEAICMLSVRAQDTWINRLDASQRQTGERS